MAVKSVQMARCAMAKESVLNWKITVVFLRQNKMLTVQAIWRFLFVIQVALRITSQQIVQQELYA
jgi:hypothetical protein